MEKEKVRTELSLFYERFTGLIRISGKSVNCIERELNYSRNALHNYKQGMELSGSRLLELTDYFNVSPEYLIGKSEETNSTTSKIVFEHLSNEEKYRLYMPQIWIESF